jgi:hypothetical protein
MHFDFAGRQAFHFIIYVDIMRTETARVNSAPGV